MDLQRTEYPAIVKSLQPPQAVRILIDRISYIKTVNAEIAEWLGDRKRIEEQYAASLNRLSARPLGQQGQKLDLGVFETPWNKIVSSTITIANSHQTFANSIDTEVEKPLRTFATSSREMNNIENIVANVQSLARDVDTATKKAEKLNSKGGKADAQRVADAATGVEDAEGQWSSQAPYVFERLQELDVLRLELLQKCLTQYQTFADETRNSTSTSVEECLNALLNVQIADEVVLFAQRSRRPTTARERRFSRPQQPTLADSSSLAPPPIPAQYDASSIRSGSFQENAPSEGKRSKFGDGLKRFSTVLKGRRHSTHPYGQQLQSPEKKRSSTNVGARFPGFARKHKDSSEALSTQSTRDRQHLDPESSTLNRRASDISASRSLERVASAHSTTQRPDAVTEEPPVPPLVNGNDNHLPEIPSSDPATALFDPSDITTSAQPNSVNNVFDYQPPPGPPPSAMAANQNRNSTIPEPSYGSEVSTNAIDQAMHEASAVSENGGQGQFKVDIRNAPIQEEDADASAALANVATALRSQATPRRAPTLRGRRDRNTIILQPDAVPQLPGAPAASSPQTSLPPSTQSPVEATASATPSALTSPVTTNTDQPPLTLQNSAVSQLSPVVLAQATPIKGTTRSLIADETAGSDTHSIRSGRSLSSNVSNTIRHPEMTSQGLNASMVETVSAWFEAGNCTKAVLIGEIALVHNSSSSNASDTDTIKFDNFDTLEKVAPNPLFIDPVAGKAGTYSVQLSHINRQQVAFKYQTQIDLDDASSYAPIRLVPAWKVDTNQTLVMLSYSFNPAFASRLPSGSTSITLSNVILIVHVDPGAGKILRCQAQGGGTYSRERNLAYWRLNEVTLPSDGSPQVLRARFFTDGQATPGNAEARWELSGNQTATAGSGINISRLEGAEPGFETAANDPFADEDAATTPTVSWHDVATIKRLRSGTYVGIS